MEVFDWEGFENDQSNSAIVQSVLEKRIFKKNKNRKGRYLNNLSKSKIGCDEPIYKKHLV